MSKLPTTDLLSRALFYCLTPVPTTKDSKTRLSTRESNTRYFIKNLDLFNELCMQLHALHVEAKLFRASTENYATERFSNINPLCYLPPNRWLSLNELGFHCICPHYQETPASARESRQNAFVHGSYLPNFVRTFSVRPAYAYNL